MKLYWCVEVMLKKTKDAMCMLSLMVLLPLLLLLLHKLRVFKLKLLRNVKADYELNHIIIQYMIFFFIDEPAAGSSMKKHFF